MKLEKDDYMNIAIAIIKKGEYDGTVEYEKGEETLFVDYSLRLYGDFNEDSQWECNDFYVNIGEVTCCTKDEDNLEHDFDENKLHYEEADFYNFGYNF